MKNLKRVILLCSITLLSIISVSSIVFASSYKFGANMEYRCVDGKSNGVTYSIGTNKKISISGTAGCYSYSIKDHESDSSGNLCAAQSTSIYLFETTTIGKKSAICHTDVTIEAIGDTKTFSCSGTSQYSTPKYIYIVKGLNDGRNLSISGDIYY